jgi:hypothetical protein
MLLPQNSKKYHFILFPKDLMGEPYHVMSEWWCKHFFGIPACPEECLSPFEAILSLDSPLKNKLKPKPLVNGKVQEQGLRY